jgi:hypothetical protein
MLLVLWIFLIKIFVELKDTRRFRNPDSGKGVRSNFKKIIESKFLPELDRVL